MGIAEIIKKIWQPVEAVAAADHIAEKIKGIGKAKDGIETATKTINAGLGGFGTDDETSSLIAIWETLPEEFRNSPFPKDMMLRIMTAIGRLREGQQSFVIRLVGSRAIQAISDKKEGEITGKRNIDGYHILQVFAYVIMRTDDAITERATLIASSKNKVAPKIIKKFLANKISDDIKDGEDGLVKFLKDGFVKEPGKYAKEVIDGIGEIATKVAEEMGFESLEKMKEHGVSFKNRMKTKLENERNRKQTKGE